MKQKSYNDGPAVNEVEVILPASTITDLTIRIPPEMMPNDQLATEHFKFYFANIHPYIPVIHQVTFWRHWRTDRQAISPLLLEGIFACTTFMCGQQEEGSKWLALASKHEKSYEDQPRLSTLQARVLLMKAQESSPKRGYYYRSWVNISSMVVMAKEMDLHEHFENHQLGVSCGFSPAECLTRTRVWHALFTLEVNIGGAQGRFDYGASRETVDFSVPTTVPDHDQAELQTSRQFAYFLQIAKNISVSNAILGKLRKKRADWALSQENLEHNRDFEEWGKDFAPDMQISIPEDGSLPWIPSHFVANTHAYHHLTIVMHHRAQLQTYNKMQNPAWKDQLEICFASAKKLCVLQEAIMRDYKLEGLCFMQRGLSFTVYAVLTCVLIHLVSTI